MELVNFRVEEKLQHFPGKTGFPSGAALKIAPSTNPKRCDQILKQLGTGIEIVSQESVSPMLVFLRTLKIQGPHTPVFCGP